MRRLGKLYVEREITRPEWGALAWRSRAATIFQTPEWCDVVMAAFPGYSVEAVGVRTEEGQLIVVLPLVCTWRSALSRVGGGGYESIPPFCYGGPVFERRPENRDLSEAVRLACAHRGMGAREIIIHGHPHFPLRLENPFRQEKRQSHILHLGRPYEQINAGYNEATRRWLRKARAAGMQVRVAKGTEEWRRYYETYLESRSRWGKDATSQHTWEFIEAVSGLNVDVAKLWIALHQGRICAGAIVLYKYPVLYYWHGAFSQEFAQLSPSKWLHDRIIDDANARGFHTYDMLGSGGHDGVVKFKEALGARRVEFSSYYWQCSALRRLELASHRAFGGAARLLREHLPKL